MREILINYNSFMETTFNNNAMLTGMVTAMLLGSATYTMRTYPRKLYWFIIKHLSKTLEVTSDNKIFNDIMSKLDEEDLIKKSRNFLLLNGVWGWHKKHTLGIGVSSGWYVLYGSLVLIHVTEKQTKGDRIIRELYIRAFFSGARVIQKLIDGVNDSLDDIDKTNIYRVIEDSITLFSKQRRYNLSNIVLSKDNEEEVRKVIEFTTRKDEYMRLNIPFKYGVLLEGIPGGGKTKLAKCIAGEIGWDILEIKNPTDMNNLSKLDSPTVVVVEEVDKYTSINKDNDEADTDIGVIKDLLLGDVLTGIDGLCELDSVIIIFTTNYVEKLDPALIRDGRMDSKCNFTKITMYEFKQFFRLYYPTVNISDIKFDKYNVIECTGSSLEKAKRQGLTSEEFINKFLQER